MKLKPYAMITAFVLTALLLQFAPAFPVYQVAAATRCNWVGFVADVTIPDGTTFNAATGAGFIKTWRLKNIGTCTWSTAYNLVFARGDQLSYLSSSPLPREVKPGETIDLSVPMRAHFVAGHYRGYWQLQAADGTFFGMGTDAAAPFWVDINVVDSGTSTSGYDFTANLCAATWRSGAGLLPCPNSGDARGYAARIESPRLEDNKLDPLPGILMVPQNKYNGYVQGTYPEFTVQPGDRFQTVVGCEYGKACYVTYRLEYEIGSGGPVILWKWSEKNEGLTYRLDKDLSALAGKKVKFTLTLLAAGPATNDFALWGHPQIVRAGGGSVPTATASGPTPTAPATAIMTTTPVTNATPIPPPAPGAYYDFASNACSASWLSGAGALPCPGADGDSRGFVLQVGSPKLENGAIDSAMGLVLFPQNKYDGYIKGRYPEIAIQAGDRFQGIVGCAYASSCYVTFKLDYQIGTGPVTTFWSWKEKNEGLYYRVDKDLSSLAGKKVKFILTILSTGYATGDRVIWGQPRIVRSGYAPATPTTTAEPPKVVGATANVFKLGTDICGQPNPVEVSGTITTNGPATVTYHWEMRGDKTNTTADQVLIFTSAGTQTINEGAYKVDCGNYSARLVITTPNSFDAITYYSVNPATGTASPTPTATAIPPGNVTSVTTTLNLPELVDCLRPVTLDLIGNISTNGPAAVTYHWELGTDTNINDTLADTPAIFTTASTLAVSLPEYSVYCGNHFARLVVTSPNAISAQANFPLTQLTVLPIYNFSTFKLIGTMSCSDFVTHTWTQEPCNGESGGCWISQIPLFGVAYAGFFRWEGNKICGLNLP
jgi:hypothetical protein